MTPRPDPEQVDRDWIAAARVDRDREREPVLHRHPLCVVPTSAARGEPLRYRHPRCVVPISATRGAFQASVIDSVNRAERQTLRAECPACRDPIDVSTDSDRELIACATCGLELITRRTIDGVDVVPRTPRVDLAEVAS